MRSLHKKPWWEPSKQHGYHAFSLGRLAEEAARRTEGRSRGRFWRKEMAKRPGTGCHIGLPAHDTRFATFIPIQGKSRLFLCAHKSRFVLQSALPPELNFRGSLCHRFLHGAANLMVGLRDALLVEVLAQHAEHAVAIGLVEIGSDDIFSVGLRCRADKA